MEGEAIETVERSVAGLLRTLGYEMDSNVWGSIVTFSNDANEIQPLRPAQEVSPPSLSAEGGTNIAAAIELILHRIREVRLENPSKPIPEVVIITDGQLGHHIEFETELREVSYVIGIAVGPHADVRQLRKLCSTVAVIPTNNAATIEETLEWIGEVVKTSSSADPSARYPRPPCSIEFLGSSAMIRAGSKTGS